MSTGAKPKFLKPEDDSIAAERDAEPSDDQVTTFVFNPHQSLSVTAQRQRLPIREYRDTILYCLENYQTLILVGETGCGKSTQVPQYLYEFGWHRKGKIAITQPRRIAALSLAERVAYERGEETGQTVGVCIRFLEKLSDNTKIKYMTEGILLREIQKDPLLTQYGVIMVDEAHERSANTDLLLAVLKQIMKHREELKVIVSSATIDADFFKDYFNLPSEKNKNKDTAIPLSIHGRMYSIEIYHLNKPTPNYIKETVETVLKIHKSEPRGDILAFLTGQDEVMEAVDMLKERFVATSDDDMLILPFYGTLSNHHQLKVFFSAPKGFRKVVLATNIAEASVTIPNIVYVIDCGCVKLKFYRPECHLDQLGVVPISKASATQRAGRAGRVRPGKVYRLYPEKEYEKLPDQTPPEMTRSEISSVILYMKTLGLKNIFEFDFPSPPPVVNIGNALELLYALDITDIKTELTNPAGVTIAEIPFHPTMGKMLYEAGRMGCSDEIISIIAMLQVQNVFAKPTTGEGKLRLREAKRRFEVAQGDLITLLNVYTAFVVADCTKEFCGQNYLSYKNLKRAVELREQILKFATHGIGIPLVACDGDVNKILRCITIGYFTNAAYYHYTATYKSIRGDLPLAIHPSSCLHEVTPSRCVVFCELVQTTQIFMKDVTVIERDWLVELAPHYYHITTVKGK